MNKYIIIILSIATLLVWGVVSCSKSEDTSLLNTEPPKSDNCSECDKYKEMIKNDPDFANYQGYLDSLYCNQNGNGTFSCQFKSSMSRLSDETGYFFYDVSYFIREKFRIKNILNSKYNLADPNGKLYSHVYYSSIPSDTPYLAPITIWCDFNENEPYDKPIVGATSEVCMYYNISAKRYTQNYNMNFQGARQLGDTIRLITPQKTITDKGVNTNYFCFYYIIVSKDRESAELIVEFYTQGSPRKLMKRITGYMLKRWHK